VPVPTAGTIISTPAAPPGSDAKFGKDGGLNASLQDWLQLRGEQAGVLFCPINKAGKIELRQMSDQAVFKMLKKRAAQAGVAAFSPHDLRRTFISDLLDAGADIATVQKLAGHASVRAGGECQRGAMVSQRRNRQRAGLDCW